jgi:hypothetical protein
VTKQRTAQIITSIVLATAMITVVGRKVGWKLPATRTLKATAAEATPQDAIYAMLDAAREGDVRKFLSSYSGQMAQSLEQTVRESTESGFAKYLKESNAAVKGIAITEPQPLTDREVKARVEYVYQDRNEIQYMYLEKINGAWKITRVDSAERVKTLVPYGTPVQ